MDPFAGEVTLIDAWILCSFGLSVGMISGLLGIGGGMILTPALHAMGMSMPVAVATTLAQMIASSFTASYHHLKAKRLVKPLVLFLGGTALLGVVSGRFLMGHLVRGDQADQVGRYAFVAVMALIVVKMMRKPRDKPWRFGPSYEVAGFSLPVVLVVLMGFFAGFSSALTGLGGGFLFVPLLHRGLRLSLKEAVGTSSGCILLSATAAALVYGAQGLVDWRSAAFLALGALLGGYGGAKLHHRMPKAWVKGLFLALLTVSSLSMSLLILAQKDLAHGLVWAGSLAILAMALWMGIVAKEPQNPEGKKV